LRARTAARSVRFIPPKVRTQTIPSHFERRNNAAAACSSLVYKKFHNLQTYVGSFRPCRFIGGANPRSGKFTPSKWMGERFRTVIDGTYAVMQDDIIIGQGSGDRKLAYRPRARNIRPRAEVTASGVRTQRPPGLARSHHLLVLPRTGQPNYVLFENASIAAACESYIGMLGGVKPIGFTDGCSAGAAAHELGPAFGLWHEHQRLDRGGYITVLYDNIDKR
jgi:Astacin (Peptidase family M12A)